MLKSLTDAFRKHDHQQTGTVTINYEQVKQKKPLVYHKTQCLSKLDFTECILLCINLAVSTFLTKSSESVFYLLNP